MDPREEGVTRLGETLTPTFDLYDKRRDEWSFLFDEVLFNVTSSLIAAGGAAVMSKWQLAGVPGFLYSFDKIINGSSQFISIKVQVPPVVGGAWVVGPDPHYRDLRWGGPGIVVPQIISTVENTTGAAGTTYIGLMSANTVLDMSLVFPGAAALIIDPFSLNVALPLGITVWGRFRRLTVEEANG